MGDNSDQETIPVLIITERKSPRSKTLVEKLKEVENIDVVLVDASITPTYELCHEFDISYSQKHARISTGRELSPGEIGCAHSHNVARKIISNSKFGGVILEDDARICNTEIFRNSVMTFLRTKNAEASVLSLAGWKPRSLSENQHNAKNRVVEISKLFGVPPLAVGYALTPLAAKMLFDANSPVNSTADWPISECSYSVTNEILIFHGDNQTASIIDGGEGSVRVRPTFAKRLRVFLFLDFCLNRSKELDFRTYFTQVWLMKFYFYIDAVRMKMKK